MEKYRRVPPVKDADATPPDDAVVRVQVQGKIGNYVTYATSKLEDPEKARVEIVGLGRAINTAVTVAEILRRKVDHVHQLTTLSSVSLKDRWEPLEEGLDPIETERTVSCIAIQLVKGDESSLDKSAPGYSPPLESDESALVSGALDAAERDRVRASRGRGGGGGGTYGGRGGGRGGRRGRGGAGPRRGRGGHAAASGATVNGNGNSNDANGAAHHEVNRGPRPAPSSSGGTAHGGNGASVPSSARKANAGASTGVASGSEKKHVHRN